MSRADEAPLILSARGIKKAYRKGPIEVPVLRGTDLDVHEGELLAIIGQSGSGKSTLLHLLGMLDKADSGEISLFDIEVNALPRSACNDLRNTVIGLIFQSYHLLPEMTALENVLAPAMIRHGVFAYLGKKRELKKRATALLERVGLGHRLTHKPRELSGGEMQRTAIARALMNEPRLLLADEPTGNLDTKTSREVHQLLFRLNEEQRITMLIVTHNRELASQVPRSIRMQDGRLIASEQKSAEDLARARELAFVDPDAEEGDE